MRLNYTKLEHEILAQGDSLSSFAEKLNMSSTGFRRSFQTKKLKVETLEMILGIIDKPVSYFFDEEEHIQDDGCRSCSKKEKEIQRLEKKNAKLANELCRIQSRYIEQLEKGNSETEKQETA